MLIITEVKSYQQLFHIIEVNRYWFFIAIFTANANKIVKISLCCSLGYALHLMRENFNLFLYGCLIFHLIGIKLCVCVLNFAEYFSLNLAKYYQCLRSDIENFQQCFVFCPALLRYLGFFLVSSIFCFSQIL